MNKQHSTQLILVGLAYLVLLLVTFSVLNLSRLHRKIAILDHPRFWVGPTVYWEDGRKKVWSKKLPVMRGPIPLDLERLLDGYMGGQVKFERLHKDATAEVVGHSFGHELSLFMYSLPSKPANVNFEREIYFAGYPWADFVMIFTVCFMLFCLVLRRFAVKQLALQRICQVAIIMPFLLIACRQVAGQYFLYHYHDKNMILGQRRFVSKWIAGYEGWERGKWFLGKGVPLHVRNYLRYELSSYPRAHDKHDPDLHNLVQEGGSSMIVVKGPSYQSNARTEASQ